MNGMIVGQIKHKKYQIIKLLAAILRLKACGIWEEKQRLADSKSGLCVSVSDTTYIPVDSVAVGKHFKYRNKHVDQAQKRLHLHVIKRNTCH
jgi:hypothetical protein